MGVSPDRESMDVVQMHQKFQAFQAPPQVPMQTYTQPSVQSPEIMQQNPANEQMTQLTQILSQLNMNLVNSQMNSACTQQSVDKLDPEQTQHSTQMQRNPEQSKNQSEDKKFIECTAKKQPKTTDKSQSGKNQKGK